MMTKGGGRTLNSLRLGASVGAEKQQPEEDPISKESSAELSSGSTLHSNTLRWRMRHTPDSSVDYCATNETTSTATTNTEPSTVAASTTGNGNGNGNTGTSNDGKDPSMESAMMRSRTNFSNSCYMAPETKSSPYSVPSGAPITPQRDPLTTPSRLSPERKTLPKSLKLPLLSSPAGSESLTDQHQGTHPSPLCGKRLQFFDDTVSDQVPFDQVWNQQEFTLADDQKISDASGSEHASGSEQGYDHKQDGHDDDDEDNDHDNDDDQSAKTETSKPFDEAVPHIHMRKSDKSAASTFPGDTSSNTGAGLPPPPPPPPRITKRSSLPASMESPATSPRRSSTGNIINRIKPFTSPVPGNSPPSDQTEPLDTRQQSYSARNSFEDGDIPSDEYESKLSQRSGLDTQNCSLATASKRTTAEIVGQKTTAEVLSGSGHSNNRRRHRKGKDQRDSHDSEEDEKSVDTLFDFKDQRARSSHSRSLAAQPSSSPKSSPKSPGKWRKRAPTAELASNHDDDDDDDDDEESVDDQNGNGSASPSGRVKGLKTRAQEAFATRRRFPRPSSPRSKEQQPLPQGGSNLPEQALIPVKEDPPEQSNEQVPPPLSKPRNQVSFGATDTIHHFQCDLYSEPEESVLSTGTYENNKSIGSDVEEAIKDIFMINALGACNPSPRKIRYHSETRFERRDSNLSSDEEDTATGAPSDDDDDGDEGSPPQRRSSDPDRATKEKIRNAAPQQEDVFFEAMLSMVEGGIGAMTAALGFATAEIVAEKPSSLKEDKPRSRALPPTAERGRTTTRSQRPILVPPSTLPPSDDDIDESEESSETTEDLESEAPLDEREIEKEEATKAPTGPQTLEDDPRLLELAKQAALCMHEVLGVHYDESQGVDIGDIKFVVVVLALPLGLIFQEDYSGCWVTKVMPDGNAARSCRVDPGDQLAAIDGTSSIGMKVDDICDAISEAASRSKQIELTFLRYVGPFQPLPSEGHTQSGNIRLKQTTEVGEGSDDLYPSQEDSLSLEEDKPSSTLSVTNVLGSKSPKKKAKSQKAPKSPKQGGFRNKFKWLNGRKKNATKAE